MQYTEVIAAVEDAWEKFTDELVARGFTGVQVERFETLLDRKDVYSAVDQCAVEAAL